MRDFLILFVHLIVTMARLARPGGLRSVVAESVLVQVEIAQQMANHESARTAAEKPLTTGWAGSFGSPNDLGSPPIVNAQAFEPAIRSSWRGVEQNVRCRRRLR